VLATTWGQRWRQLNCSNTEYRLPHCLISYFDVLEQGLTRRESARYQLVFFWPKRKIKREAELCFKTLEDFLVRFFDAKLCFAHFTIFFLLNKRFFFLDPKNHLFMLHFLCPKTPKKMTSSDRRTTF
jgi:hypothetical protein